MKRIQDALRRRFSHRQSETVIIRAVVVETLEIRRLLSSTIQVENLADSGSGSLRQAILDADSAGGDQTITFDPSLTANGPATITLGGTALVLNDPSPSTLTIVGPGLGLLTIDAHGLSQVFVNDSGAGAEIDNLTITGGYSSFFGGGIGNAGTLKLNDIAVSNNNGDYIAGIENSGDLTITGSTISGNDTTGYAGGISSTGNLSVIDSTVSGNSAGGYGGGIYNIGGELTVTNSTIDDNSGSKGAGIANFGTATITNSTVSGNTADSWGGAIYNAASLEITDSTISGNSAFTGGGINNAGGTLNFTGQL